MRGELTPLLVISGPTASGKSRLGLGVADRVNGEIVSADAFAVYRGLDIGTDKPSVEDRHRVRHHLIDIADPRHRFSAGEFVEAASAAITDIIDRGRTPLVVGGTHFYVQALLRGLFPAPPKDAAVRRRLANEWQRDPDAVFARLQEVDPERALRIGKRDRQRVLRALEVYETSGEPLTSHWRRQRQEPRFRYLMVAPSVPRNELYARIDARADRLFAFGLVEEVRRIVASGVPVDAHALKAIGYRQVVELIEGHCDLETAIDDTKRASRNLAKRQLTWLRGLLDEGLHWVPPAEEGGVSAITDLWDQLTEGR